MSDEAFDPVRQFWLFPTVRNSKICIACNHGIYKTKGEPLFIFLAPTFREAVPRFVKTGYAKTGSQFHLTKWLLLLDCLEAKKHNVAIRLAVIHFPGVLIINTDKNKQLKNFYQNSVLIVLMCEKYLVLINLTKTKSTLRFSSSSDL